MTIGLAAGVERVLRTRYEKLGLGGEALDIRSTEVSRDSGGVEVFDPETGCFLHLLPCIDYCPGDENHGPHPVYSVFCYNETGFFEEGHCDYAAPTAPEAAHWAVAKLLSYRASLSLYRVPDVGAILAMGQQK